MAVRPPVLVILFALAFCACDGDDHVAGPSPVAPLSGGINAIPAATYLRGLVIDTASRAVIGATVEVIDGPLAGTRVLTDDRGYFEIDGLMTTGRVNLRASSEGFVAQTRSTDWVPRGTLRYVSFELDSAEAPLPIQPGRYRLTVVTDPATGRGGSAPCEGFPAEFTSPQFEVTVRRDDRRPATFFQVDVPGQIGFGFGVSGRFVGFEIDLGLWKPLPDNQLLIVNGIAPTMDPASIEPDGFSVPFSGSIEYCRSSSPIGGRTCFTAETVVSYRQCISAHDRMIFTQQ